MLLRYQLFRQQGPDRWRFAYFSDQNRIDQTTAAITTAVENVYTKYFADPEVKVPLKGGWFKKGCTVLDVGAGSGLMAMISSRAGAAAVVTLERTQAAQTMVSKIAKANDFSSFKLKPVWASSDAIWCMAKAATSTEDQQCVMDERADIVTMEVVEPSLLGERLCDFIYLGQNKDLTVEDVTMIPSKAELWMAPIDCPVQPISLEKPLRDEISELDLHEFDKFRRHKLQPVSLIHTKYSLYCAGRIKTVDGDRYQMLAEPTLLDCLHFDQALESCKQLRVRILLILVSTVCRKKSSFRRLMMARGMVRSLAACTG